MAIVINGSGTVTGLAVGGLPDDIVDAGMMADNSIDSDAYVDASIDNAHLADDAVGVAELSATGTASSSTFLRGDNAWAEAGGGKVLQVVNAVDASETLSTSTTQADTGLTADITPSATSSKVLVMVGMNFGITGGSGGVGSRLMRDSTSIRGASEKSDGHGAGESSYHEAWIAFDYLDSPNTTSATTYKMQFKTNSSGQAVFTSIDNNVSTITLNEIKTTDALQSLKPKAEWVLRGSELEWHDSVQTEPTQSEIDAEVTRLQAVYDSKAYARSRKTEYPSIADQLDDIYHNGVDGWKATIKTTKDKYPKP